MMTVIGTHQTPHGSLLPTRYEIIQDVKCYFKSENWQKIS